MKLLHNINLKNRLTDTCQYILNHCKVLCTLFQRAIQRSQYLNSTSTYAVINHFSRYEIEDFIFQKMKYPFTNFALLFIYST